MQTHETTELRLLFIYELQMHRNINGAKNALFHFLLREKKDIRFFPLWLVYIARLATMSLLREKDTCKYTAPFAMIPFVAVDSNLKWTCCVRFCGKHKALGRRVIVVVSQFYLTTAKTASATFIRIRRSYS